jgi:hypothetical protein
MNFICMKIILVLEKFKKMMGNKIVSVPVNMTFYRKNNKILKINNLKEIKQSKMKA